MDFRCPSCQKDLTVPDEYAGQLMKCPLCQNTFQAPALPPPIAPSPPPGPGTYGVSVEPAPPPVPPPLPPQEAPRRKKELPEAPPLPPVPTGEHAQTRTLWISPRVVPWVAPAALLLAFLLTFFPWAYTYPDGDRLIVDHIAWGWGWSPEWDMLTLLYTLVLLPALLASGAITVLRLVPGFKVPPALQQVWPWRSVLVALLAGMGLFFLVLQLFVGFVPNSVAKEATTDVLARLHLTPWVWLALVAQVVALVGALLDFWLEIRGPGRPTPRVDMSW